MGLLDDQMAADASQAFLDTDLFAETIKYVPSRANQARGVTVKDIKAVVVREIPVAQRGTAMDVTHKLAIIVANDEATGISSAKVDFGGDQVQVSLRVGGAVETHTIKQQASAETHDSGMLALEV